MDRFSQNKAVLLEKTKSDNSNIFELEKGSYSDTSSGVLLWCITEAVKNSRFFEVLIVLSL